jgi:plasmid stabilization system protein ParE
LRGRARPLIKMVRFRLSLLARADLAQILAGSAERWGLEGRRRYEAVPTAAMRKVATEPDGAATRDRAELSRGVRSFHLRHVRVGDSEARVRSLCARFILPRHSPRPGGDCEGAPRAHGAAPAFGRDPGRMRRRGCSSRRMALIGSPHANLTVLALSRLQRHFPECHHPAADTGGAGFPEQMARQSPQLGDQQWSAEA